MVNRKKSKFLVLVCAVFLFYSTFEGLHAQVIHDPNDPVYRDIDRWAVKGYFDETLPFIRPYPAQVLDRLLNQVVERGGGADKEKAAAYKKAIAAPERFIHAGMRARVDGENGDSIFAFAPFADGILRLGKWLSASYEYSVYAAAVNPGNEYSVPGAYSPYSDMILDWASVGSFNILQNWSSSLALGNADVFFQAGLNRSSFGPFYDNGVVLGPQAGKAGHFSLNYRRPRWSFEILLLELTASDNLGHGLYPDKHMLLHSLNFRPTRSLELSFVESVVWGDRFEFLYLIPFNFLFAAQSMTHFNDNSFIGVNARWAAFRDTQILFQVYVDDFHFNDFVRLQFNSKYKLAGELGAVWAPKDSPLLSLAADYTAVFPYMYSHWTTLDDDRYENPAVNYVNYSHLGRSLGTNLKPNSDRFSLRTRWRVLRGLEFKASLYLSRHANASEAVDDMDERWHDGSIYDDGSQDHAPYVFNFDKMHFLTQSVIDTRLGSGLGLDWFLPVSFGTFSVGADYVLEYGWNRNLHKADNGFTHYWSFIGTFRW